MIVIISDTSPLNYLILIEHIDVLPKLFGRVIIPPAVFAELQVEETPQVVRDYMASRLQWLEIRSISNPPDSALNFLDDGEREAIALAKELSADAIIIDEENGRHEAIRMLRLLIDNDFNQIILRGLMRRVSGLEAVTAHEAGLSEARNFMSRYTVWNCNSRGLRLGARFERPRISTPTT